MINKFAHIPNLFKLGLVCLATSVCADAPLSAPNTVTGVPKALQKLHDEQVNINFNNASLQNIADEISTLFNITFLPDDALKKADGTPLGKGLADHKVTFNTHRTLTANQALNLFKTFLELAGFSMIATYDPLVYRITTIANANKSPLPTYINSPIESVPNNDTRIRYVLIIVNNSPKDIGTTLTKLKSKQATIEAFDDLNALVITDKAYNVRGLIQIARELDSGNLPETLSVIKLQEADADEVAKTIENLKQKDGQRPQWGAAKKQPLFYFPSDVKLIPSRNNTLIILGGKEGVRRIENFISEHIDKKLKTNYNLLHVYPLNYALAEPVAEILTQVVQFGKTSSGAQNVSAETYFSDVFIQAEKQNNSLIIKANKEDYAMLQPIINGLDVQQPQVAIEVLIVDLRINKSKGLASQVRNRSDQTVNWQTSGFFNNAESTPQLAADGSLLGNLLELVKTLNGSLAGTTLLSLGKTSVWALFGILEKTTQSRVLSNPFLVSTNKYKASVSLGETRNVATQKISSGGEQGTQGFTEISAELKVTIVPQINEFGIINLNIEVLLEEFTSSESTTAANSQSLGNKEIRVVKTTANVADGEVLALGGLIKSKSNSAITGTPALQRIPIVGRIFSNQNDVNDKENLVIFIAPKVIQPQQKTSQYYTENKADYLQQQFASFKRDDDHFQPNDPVRKWFFDPDKIDQSEQTLEFMYATKTQKEAKQKALEAAIKEKEKEEKPATKETAAPKEIKKEDEQKETDSTKKSSPIMNVATHKGHTS
ncbi:MAG TPA: secretin N-terminal domain-containing protein [Candidatus Babeliales bacterium]|nr:secretin N-terminal domain-containing protein [Candidatus Babeliales bacterium]